MNNQERKVRPNIFNVNGNDLVFFSFSIKTSKYIGSWNNINNPCTKLCVSDVATNETRLIEWHETCRCKCRFNNSVCNNK